MPSFPGLAASAAWAGAAGSAAGFGVAACVPGAVFTVAAFANVEVLAGADFDAVLGDCARLDPARAKTNATSAAKARIRPPTCTLIPLLFLSLISLLLFQICSGFMRLRKKPSHYHPEEAKSVLSIAKEGPLYSLGNSNTGVLRFAQDDSIGAFFRNLIHPGTLAPQALKKTISSVSRRTKAQRSAKDNVFALRPFAASRLCVRLWYF